MLARLACWLLRMAWMGWRDLLHWLDMATGWLGIGWLLRMACWRDLLALKVPMQNF